MAVEFRLTMCSNASPPITSKHIRDMLLPAQQLITELSAHAAKLETEIPSRQMRRQQRSSAQALEETRRRIEAITGIARQKRRGPIPAALRREKALHHAAFVTNAEDPDYHALHSLSFEDQGKSQTMQVPKGDILLSIPQGCE